jgi:hypothetical protein
MAQTPDFEEMWAPELTLPPLGNGTTDIRLLTLLPGRISDHIRCTLSTASLASNETRYSALSYTWGDPSGQRSIECNGCRAYLRRNLHSAPSRLRDTHQVVILWADALCINQLETDEALEERDVQVQLMHKIFSQAELVYVDLGEDVPEMEKVLQLLQKIDFFRSLTSREFENICLASATSGLPDIEHPTWPDIVRFMRRPWFTRVWIMQEFILAKHVQVVVGIRRLQIVFLERLLLASCFYKSLGTDIFTKHAENSQFSVSYWRLLSQLEQGRDNLLSLMAARKNRQKNKMDSRNFSTLLIRSSTFDATDKRDRAYALLSLTDDVDHDMFPVRYKNETLDQTAQRVSRYLLVESDCRHVNRGAALYRTVGLVGPGPSWAYDLARASHDDDSVLTKPGIGKDSTIYQAGAGGDHLEASIVGATLTVRGYVLGSIAQLCSTFPPPAPGQSLLGLLCHLDWVLSVACWATRIQLFSNTKLDELAVWVTAFAGCFWQETLGEVVRYDREEHAEITQHLSDFVKSIEELQDKFRGPGKLEDVLPSCSHLFLKMIPITRSISASAYGRRLAYTSDDLMALVPGSAKVGGVLSIFQGTPIPFVLRKVQGNYRLVGSAYIHNMMDGEVLRDPRWTAQNIDIC